MREWMGSQTERAADDFKVMEPPETPAPMFALRAFQSALFGTPKADEEDNTNAHLKCTEQGSNRQSSRGSTFLKPVERNRDSSKVTIGDIDPAVNAMASPTKSILMTPGTVSNRRKTVSFGDGVVDNERQRDDVLTKPVKTPIPATGNISSQWASSSSEGKRSKLTQALMDSREKPSRTSEKSSQKVDEVRSAKLTANPDAAPAQGDDNEDTININEPRSRSGKYWKAEFDSYRSKTALEIRRLIQYRSAAKTYARKKDEEAYRLAAKLKEEELRVEEMERHVTQLASTMVAENTRADKEQLVQDLTKQTALALQYKHKVSLLRKTLEQHGVVGSEIDEIAGASETSVAPKETSEALQKSQQALAEANAKVEEMKRQQSDFEKLKGLALSSEQKASNLARENASLKHTLARFKQEASKYEGRRKEREARLKSRESKLETRIQEYRDRLKSASQQHRKQEEELRLSFDHERRQMQEQIDVLKTKLRALESATELRVRARPESRRDFDGVQTYNFDATSPHKDALDETGEIDQPPSPSPRGKDRHSLNLGIDLTDLDLRRAMKEMGIEDIDEKFNNLGISPLNSFKPPRYRDDTDILPPSSPPEVTTWSASNQRRNPDTRHSHLLYVPRRSLDDSHQIQTNRSQSRGAATKYALDHSSSAPDTHRMDHARRRQTLATATTTSQRDALALDRKMAAQARLRRRDESRKLTTRDDGKENVRTAVRA
ncbi:spindle pole body formation-associated protein-domain-containing protein [Aspergillus recurvatus]